MRKNPLYYLLVVIKIRGLLLSKVTADKPAVLARPYKLPDIAAKTVVKINTLINTASWMIVFFMLFVGFIGD
jgi:hypothetical protein